MSNTVIAVVLALVSALCYAVGAAIQQSEAATAGDRAEDPGEAPRGIVGALVRRRRWWLGFCAVVAGAGLHVTALGIAPISLVQPIGMTALVLALPIGARFNGRLVRPAQWWGAVIVLAGLIGLVSVAPRGGAPWLLAWPTIVTTAAVAATVAGALALVAARRSPAMRAVLQATATGVCFGATSAMIRILLAGLASPASSGDLVGAVIAGVAAAGFATTGSVLLQTAYRDGGLGAPLAMVTLVDPVVACAIGVVVLGERFAGGAPGVWVAAVSGTVAVGGLLTLVRASTPAPRNATRASAARHAPRGAVPDGREPATSKRATNGPTIGDPGLRVVIGADTYFPDVNGAARFTERLATGLAERGHDVHVVAPSPTGEPHRHRLDGVTVHRVRSHRYRQRTGFRMCLPWAAARATRAVLEELNPDVVHVQSHFAIGRGLINAARRAGTPVVATNHVMPENLIGHFPVPPALRRPAYGLMWRDLRRVLGKAAVVTAPTPRAVELLATAARLDHAIPVSCGIDIENYHTDPPAGTHFGEASSCTSTPSGRAPIVLFVGRLDPEKRVDELIRAVAALPPTMPIHLEIVGDGTLRDEWAELGRELGLGARLSFRGLVSEEELVAAYASAAVFVMPGIAELQSLATLEAMAASTPVIAADAMALPHLVHPGRNGWLYPPGDVPALSAHLTRLLADPALRTRMGSVSRDMVAEHSLDATLATFENIYARLLGRVPEHQSA
jgi:glycosyltransferase involved in cell wall biosynthesis/drug/metabolite transporter (DMT)-like permease